MKAVLAQMSLSEKAEMAQQMEQLRIFQLPDQIGTD